MQNIRKEAIMACQDCIIICVEALAYCSKGREKISLQHVKCLKSCITLCEATVQMLLLNKTPIELLFERCIYACDKCSVGCSNYESAVMKSCEKSCRNCVGSLLNELYHIKKVV